MTGTKEEAFALEQQAIGRAYRQGQTRQVTVVRFIVKDTLEETLHYRNNTVEKKLEGTHCDALNLVSINLNFESCLPCSFVNSSWFIISHS